MKNVEREGRKEGRKKEKTQSEEERKTKITASTKKSY